MNRRIWTAALAGALVLSAGEASAGLLVATSSGVLTGDSGGQTFDTNGHFGAPGLLLNGLGYTLVTTYDTTGASAAVASNGSYLKYAGAPNVTSALTINGTTVTIQATGFIDELLDITPTTARLINYVTSGGATHAFFNMSVTNLQSSLPSNILTAGSGNLCTGASYCAGSFGFIVNSSAELVSDFTASSYTYEVTGGDLPPPAAPPPGDTVLPSIPEPSTWSLLLAGFGLAGWSLRRRRLAPS